MCVCVSCARCISKTNAGINIKVDYIIKKICIEYIKLSTKNNDKVDFGNVKSCLNEDHKRNHKIIGKISIGNAQLQLLFAHYVNKIEL